MTSKAFTLFPKETQEKILNDVKNDPTPLKAIANRHNCEFGSLMSYIQRNRIKHMVKKNIDKVVEMSDFTNPKPVHLTDDEWMKVTREMLLRAVDHIEAAKILGYSVVETENTWNERGNKSFNLEEYKKNPLKENRKLFDFLHFAISVPEFNRRVWIEYNKSIDPTGEIAKGGITAIWKNKWFKREDILIKPQYPSKITRNMKVNTISELINELNETNDWDTLIELVNDDSNSKDDIAEIFNVTIHVLNALLASNAYNRKLEAYMKEHEREEEVKEDVIKLPEFKSAADKIAFFEKEIEKARIEAELEELESKKADLMSKLNSLK